MMARLIDGLCQRYGCLPSQLMEEDARIIKMLAIITEGEEKDKNLGKQ
jgi:pyruvate/2-oxoglutarate dehydrogenase complex dihydrolipoamide dehydrogenase (E3) component